MADDAVLSTEIEAPTEPGFYRYSGGGQVMIFLLRKNLDDDLTWYTIFDNGEMGECVWGYIEQCLSVYDLIKIESDGEKDG